MKLFSQKRINQILGTKNKHPLQESHPSLSLPVDIIFIFLFPHCRGCINHFFDFIKCFTLGSTLWIFLFEGILPEIKDDAAVLQISLSKGSVLIYVSKNDYVNLKDAHLLCLCSCSIQCVPIVVHLEWMCFRPKRNLGRLFCYLGHFFQLLVCINDEFLLLDETVSTNYVVKNDYVISGNVVSNVP
jgi:hypothetical protein